MRARLTCLLLTGSIAGVPELINALLAAEFAGTMGFDRQTQTPAERMHSDDQSQQAPQRTVPLPRDPKVAVAEEFEIIKRRGTREAFDLFIARHPESPLAAEARRLRDRASTGR